MGNPKAIFEQFVSNIENIANTMAVDLFNEVVFNTPSNDEDRKMRLKFVNKVVSKARKSARKLARKTWKRAKNLSDDLEILRVYKLDKIQKAIDSLPSDSEIVRGYEAKDKAAAPYKRSIKTPIEE